MTGRSTSILDSRTKLRVSAILILNGGLVVSPPHDTVMRRGEILVVLGKEENLSQLEKKAGLNGRGT